MSVWHEPAPSGINHVLLSANGRVRAVIRRRDHFGGRNTIHFRRWQGAGSPVFPRRDPKNWIELWPWQEISAATLDAVQARARALMEQVGTGGTDDQFEIKPYAPLKRKQVKEIEHPSGTLKAIIFAWPGNRYEVRYFVHEMLGAWPDGSEEWDWWITRGDRLTFASDLPDAETIARIELEELASAKSRDKETDI